MRETVSGVPEPGPAEGGLVPRIRSLLPSLIPSDAKVARVVLEDPQKVVHLSVGDVAAVAGTSASTVVRCCQRLGFRGFQHLKIALALDGAPARGLTHRKAAQDSPREILGEVLISAAQVLEDSLFTVDVREFERAVSVLRRARRVLFVGVGTSAPLAQDAAYRFLTIGVRAEAPPDVHTQHVAARLLGSEDACFAVSHTGATRETMASVKAARDAGATTVAVTSFSRSPITEFTQVVLVAGGPETSFRLEAMTSRISHLSVLDALFVAVAAGTRERANVALDATADVLSQHRY